MAFMAINAITNVANMVSMAVTVASRGHDDGLLGLMKFIASQAMISLMASSMALMALTGSIL